MHTHRIPRVGFFIDIFCFEYDFVVHEEPWAALTHFSYIEH